MRPAATEEGMVSVRVRRERNHWKEVDDTGVGGFAADGCVFQSLMEVFRELGRSGKGNIRCGAGVPVIHRERSIAGEACWTLG